MEILIAQSFATLWLSRIALVAAVVFAYCAWKILIIDRHAIANHIAFAFNIVFMLWAAGSRSGFTAIPGFLLDLVRIPCPDPALHHSHCRLQNPGRILATALHFGPLSAIRLAFPGTALWTPCRAGL